MAEFVQVWPIFLRVNKNESKKRREWRGPCYTLLIPVVGIDSKPSVLVATQDVVINFVPLCNIGTFHGDRLTVYSVGHSLLLVNLH